MSISQCVEGDYLVIPDKIALPQRCVRTNEHVDESEYTAWDIAHTSALSFILFGVAGFLFGPSVSQQRCRFKAGLSRKFRRKNMLLKVGAYLVMLGPPFIFIASVVLELKNLLLYSLVSSAILWPAGLVFLRLYSSPFSITKFEDDHFWVLGCSQEFLRGLEDPGSMSGQSAD